MSTTKAVGIDWDKVKPLVEQAWAGVFQVVNTVIASHDNYGFKSIESKINPSLQDILRGLKVMEAILDAILAENQLEYDSSRLILNAKQQINCIELIAVALKHGREDDYEEAIAKLSRQAQF